MKRIISISLGNSKHNYSFNALFLGNSYHISRMGTDGNIEKAAELLLHYEKKSDAIGLGSVRSPYVIGHSRLIKREMNLLTQLTRKFKIPMTTGFSFSRVAHEWSIRMIHDTHNDFFSNSKIFFFSGMMSYPIAQVLSEFTDHLIFSDPVFENGIPNLIHSINELHQYANGFHNLFQWIPSFYQSAYTYPLKQWNIKFLSKAIRDAFIIVVPYYNFYKYLSRFSDDVFKNKIIITSCCYPDRREFLNQKGVHGIIDLTPVFLDQVVSDNIIEALILCHSQKQSDKLIADDFLDMIHHHAKEPTFTKINSEHSINAKRFAYITPSKTPTQQNWFNTFSQKTIQLMKTMIPVSPLFIQAQPLSPMKLSGIQSPIGNTTEGWVIPLKENVHDLSHMSSDNQWQQVTKAIKQSKSLGIQIIGFGHFPNQMIDHYLTMPNQPGLMMTTGINYKIYGMLLAALEIVSRLDFLEKSNHEQDQYHGNVFILGAAGLMGQICAKWLSKKFDNIVLVDMRTSQLKSVFKSLTETYPNTRFSLSTKSQSFIKDMNIIVLADSYSDWGIIDGNLLKPGCIVVDLVNSIQIETMPSFARKDIIIIRSGEFEIPGNPIMEHIGLSINIAEAELTECIVLALEGVLPQSIQKKNSWEIFEYITSLASLHGIKLSSISGLNGIITDDDISYVKNLIK